MDERLMTALVVFALFSLGGWAVIWIGVKGNIEARRRGEREHSRTSGKVVRLVSREHRYGRHNRRTFWYPVVAFYAEGRAYELESKDGLWADAVAEGDEVELLYDADDPSRFHLEMFGESDARSGGHLIRFGIAWVIVAVVVAVLIAKLG